MSVARGGWGRVWMGIGFALGGAAVFLGVLNNDVGWYLYAARRVLAGDRLYVDLVETNPPLIVWLNFGPVGLARGTGWSEIVCLRLLAVGLVAGSLGLTRAASVRAWPDWPGGRQAFLWLSLFVLLLLPGFDFAQREHLMLALVLPYMVLASGRARGVGEGGALPWVVGILAGLGLALKPHFVLAWIAIEVDLALVRRTWRVWLRGESLAVVAVGLVYAGAVVGFTPEYLTLIRWAGAVYASASATGPAVLANPENLQAVVVTVLGAGALGLLKPDGPGRAARRTLLVAAVAFLAIALFQDKGYSYHYYPPMALSTLLVGLLALESGRADLPVARPLLFTLRGVFGLLVVGVVVARANDALVWRGEPGRSDTTLGRMLRVIQSEPEVESFYVFSPAVAAAFPLVNESGKTWASRHPALWFLPSLYQDDSVDGATRAYHRPEAMTPTERFLFDSVIDDLIARRPTLLFVDETARKASFRNQSFDYLAYYGQDTRFVAFLKDYQPLTRVDQFQVQRRKTRADSP